MGWPGGDFVKYVIGGTLATDTWSIGLYQRLDGLTSNPTQTQMDAAAAFRLNGFNTVFWSATTAAKGLAHSGTTLSFCKAALYRNGVLTQNGSASITPVAGTGASFPHPNYVALVMTLRTASAGRSNRGRVYMPFTAVQITPSTGRVGTNAQPYVDNFALMLTGYGPDDNGFPGDPASHAVVVSRTHSTYSNITSVTMDDKPDTQRGRENKLAAGTTWTHSV